MPEEMPRLLEKRELVCAKLRGLGFAYVTLDLAGYRTGSMNETLASAGDRKTAAAKEA